MGLKVFITGGCGLLGAALSFELVKTNNVICGYHINRIDIKNENFSAMKIDITNPNSLKVVEKISPDVIIHAVALTDMEFCERNPEIAYKVNVKGTENVLHVTREIGAKMIYICTDYIFDGKKGYYSELDRPNPLSIYAKTKLRGEEIVRNYDNFISIRTSLYGWNPNPNRPSFSSRIINSLKNGKEFPVVNDQKNSLIFTNDLANILDGMLQHNLHGIYNVASANSMSRYDFALEVAEVFNLDRNLIKEISLNQFIRRFSLFAPRPKNISLDCSKITTKMKRKMPTIREGIISMREKENRFKRVVKWIK